MKTVRKTEVKHAMRKWAPSVDEANKFLMLFYGVGTVGFLIPYTQALFVLMIKWALLLNLVMLIVYHRSSFSRSFVYLFISIFVLGYLVEVIGVKSGLIFGSYSYGSGLGIKFFETPLLIGINWMIVSYMFASVTQHYIRDGWIRVIFASVGMLMYDIILEQSAGLMDMWRWGAGDVSGHNFMGWFVVAFVFQTMIKLTRVRLHNPVVNTMLMSQLMFFIIIGIYASLFV